MKKLSSLQKLYNKICKFQIPDNSKLRLPEANYRLGEKFEIFGYEDKFYYYIASHKLDDKYYLNGWIVRLYHKQYGIHKLWFESISYEEFKHALKYVNKERFIKSCLITQEQIKLSSI